MKVQKLFSSEVKPVLQKPPYVKPKHRTYRELLALDKPKRKIQVESDDQNDDFLNKILKEQDKKEKRKSSSKVNNKKSKPLSPKKIQHKKEEISSKQNINAQNIKSTVNLTDLINKQKQNKQKKQIENNKEQLRRKLQKQQTSVDLISQQKQELNVNQIQTNPNIDKTKVTFKYSQNFKKSASQKDRINKNQIYIDETSTQKYRPLQQQNKVIKNNFFSKLKVKNMQATTLLRVRTHANLIPNYNKDQNFLLTKIQQKVQTINSILKSDLKINPQEKAGNNVKQIKHQITNRFSSMQIQMPDQNKSGKLSANEKYRNVVLKLAMMEIDRIQKPLQPKKRDFNSEKLFKNEYQQKLFLKSLQSVK